MRALAAAAAAASVVLGAGCWSERAPARPKVSSTPVPGTLWVTPAQPWRATVTPRRIIADGAVALLAGYGGHVERFDLAQGKPVRDRTLTGLAIEELVKLPDGRRLAVARKEKHTVAALIDPETLEVKEVVTGIEGKAAPEGLAFTYAHVGGAVVLDEGVAIAGQGLPLAIYDPVTWKVRRVVDPAIGWSRPAGGGKLLYAFGKAGLKRFDLAAGTSERVGADTWYLATATHLVTRGLERGRWVFDIHSGGKKTRIPSGAFEATLDAATGRLAVRDGATIRIHALDGGKVLGTYDLGEAGYGSSHAIGFDGLRLVVSIWSVVRVIDLTTGAVTPAGDPPYGPGDQLHVSADGVVQQLGTHVLRIVDGKVSASAHLESDKLIVGEPGEVTRHGIIRKSDNKIVELFAAGTPGAIGTWHLDDDVGGAWLGASGTVVIDTMGISEQHALYRGSGRRLEKLVALHFDATVHDVDVDGGIALVGMKSTGYLIRLRDGSVVHKLPNIGCEEYPTAVLERGGDRLYVSGDAGFAVYHRRTGALIGAALVEDAAVAVFVRGRDELLIAGAQGVHLWNPVTGELRTREVEGGVTDLQVSPDARRAVLELAGGRLALVDLEVLRASMTVGRVPAAKVEPSCEDADPLDLGPPEIGDGDGDLGDPPDPGDPDDEGDPDP
jgi:hypothetical protein